MLAEPEKLYQSRRRRPTIPNDRHDPLRAKDIEREHSARWSSLCEVFPAALDNGIWRYSRRSRQGEPKQGWKLHISATVLEACDVFARVARICMSRDVRFKAPKTLQDLMELNSGVRYGFSQVGKFITVYPSGESQAIEIAREFDELTREFVSISVPFDQPFSEGSNVFYRYGSFEPIEMKSTDGRTVPAVKHVSGDLVHDDCTRAVPEWVCDPFDRVTRTSAVKAAETLTPLGTKYRVFRAIAQRGKGGTYQAIDISAHQPRLCILKEGRRNGELGWNRQDGYALVKNETEVLRKLGRKCTGVPRIYSSFEIEGDFYVAMECVEGSSLFDLMKVRRRRFSIRQIMNYSIGIANAIEKVHNARWVWNDCKPGNLIVAKDGTLRPIDFENAYPIGGVPSFRWSSNNFSRPSIHGAAADLYACGVVIYFMLTGKVYDPNDPKPPRAFRNGIPDEFAKLTMRVLEETESLDVTGVRQELEAIARKTRV